MEFKKKGKAAAVKNLSHFDRRFCLRGCCVLGVTCWVYTCIPVLHGVVWSTVSPVKQRLYTIIWYENVYLSVKGLCQTLSLVKYGFSTCSLQKVLSSWRSFGFSSCFDRKCCHHDSTFGGCLVKQQKRIHVDGCGKAAALYFRWNSFAQTGFLSYSNVCALLLFDTVMITPFFYFLIQ